VKRIVVALVAGLGGCSSAVGGATLSPSGEPIAVPSGNSVALVNEWDGVCNDPQLVEGLLRAGQDPDDARLTGWTYIDLSPRTDPSEVDLPAAVPVVWPRGYMAATLAGSELAILDASGKVVAETGRNYQLKAQLVLHVPLPGFSGATEVDAFFQACP